MLNDIAGDVFEMKKTIDNIVEKVTKLELQLVSNNVQNKIDKIENFLENFTEEGLYEFAKFITDLRIQNQPFGLNEIIEGAKFLKDKYRYKK
jgi:hypothetical protein